MNLSKCNTCNVFYTDQSSRLSHLSGKKHKLQQRIRDHEIIVTSSCFSIINMYINLINNLVLDLPKNLNREHIKQVFSNLGKMINCKFGPENEYVIFQYKYKETVDKLVESKTMPYLNDMLSIKAATETDLDFGNLQK